MEEDHTIRDQHTPQDEQSHKTDAVANGPKIRPIDTMAALLSAPTSQPVWVRAFYADTEGGGGHFWWDPNEDKQNHNGGIIIDPDHTATPGDAGWYSAENTGTGCWRRQFKGDMNARSFGAKGDGATDDTIAIQSALNNHDSIYVPKGQYYISDEIIINSNNKKICGEYREETIFYAPDINFDGVFVINAAGDDIDNRSNISSDVSRNSYIIPVDSTDGFEKNKVIRLKSQESLGFVDSNGIEKERFISEFVKVKEVDSVNNQLVLYQPVYFRYRVSDNSSATPVNMYKNITIKDIHIIRDKTSAEASEEGTWGIRADFIENLTINNVHISETNYTGVEIQNCYRSHVRNSLFSDLGAYETDQSSQYGIAIGSNTKHGLIESCFFEDCRHCVSIGGLSLVCDVKIIDSTLISTQFEEGLNSPAAADNHFGAEVGYINCFIQGGARVGPLRTSFENCFITNGQLDFCVGTRGYSNNKEFPREIRLNNCKLLHTSDERGPIYTTVNDSVNSFKEIVTGCYIWFLSSTQYFSLGGSEISFSDNTVKFQFNATPPVPTGTNDEFNQGVGFPDAIHLNVVNNYIEGWIRHNNSSSELLTAVISDNILYNSAAMGVFIIGDDTSPHITLSMSNNIIKNPLKDGVVLAGIDRGTIEGNTIIVNHDNTTEIQRGIEATGSCNLLKLFNNDIVSNNQPYYGNGNVGEELFIDNIFRLSDGTFLAPQMTGGDIYRSGNVGWVIESSGDPSGIITPNFVGEEILDTINNVWYKATGTTNIDWVALN